MRNNQSSINRWTWIVALLLALLLLWMLLTNRGPSNACCGVAIEAAVPMEQAAPAAPVDGTATPQPFSFSATREEVKTQGDASNIAWLAGSDHLRSVLSTGEDLRIEGNDKAVVLTGVANSDNDKQKKGEEVQSFFGAGVTVDNQIAIKAPEPAATPAAPSTAKLFFDTGKTALPADADSSLAPIIEWLKANADSKVVLSGYHDPRGNRASNEELAKNRAKAVREALKAAGVDEARIEMRKPEVVEGGSDLAEARRVEVSVE